MSDTPRTDFETYVVPDWDDLRVVEGLQRVVSAGFAKRLERELAQARAELDALQKQIDEILDDIRC